MAEYEVPVTLERDFAGLVQSVGPAVSRCKAGDEVYDFLPLRGPLPHPSSTKTAT
jgi:NADPH:quinone reductase-like Zn-dependent oxidoreductase